MLISASEIIKQSVDLYFKHFKQIWVYLAISLAPAVLLAVLAFISISLEVRQITNAVASDIILLLLKLAGLIISFWAFLALIKVFDQIIKSETIATVKTNLNLTAKMILPGILIYILIFLISFVGLLLFVIPGIIFFIWYQFSFYALVTDNKRDIMAMKASKELVVGRWLQVAWLFIAPGLVFTVMGGFLQWLIKWTALWVPNASIVQIEIAYGFTDQVVGLLTLPLLIAAGLILYENLKANPVGATPETV